MTLLVLKLACHFVDSFRTFWRAGKTTDKLTLHIFRFFVRTEHELLIRKKREETEH